MLRENSCVAGLCVDTVLEMKIAMATAAATYYGATQATLIFVGKAMPFD